jgi:hypothetical protein
MMTMLTELSVFEVPEAYLEFPVENLPLNARGHNCLRRAGIIVLGQLHGLSVNEILRLPYFGKGTLQLLVEALEHLKAGTFVPVAPARVGTPDEVPDGARELAPGLSGDTLTVPDSWRGVSLTQVDLGARATNCLIRAGYRTLGDLDGAKLTTLMRISGFGKTTLTTVQEVLGSLETFPPPVPSPDSETMMDTEPEKQDGQVSLDQVASFSSASGLLEHVIKIRCNRSGDPRMRELLRARLIERQTYDRIARDHGVTGARIQALVSACLKSNRLSPPWLVFVRECQGLMGAPIMEIESLYREVSRCLNWPFPASVDEGESFQILLQMVPGLMVCGAGEAVLVARQSESTKALVETINQGILPSTALDDLVRLARIPSGNQAAWSEFEVHLRRIVAEGSEARQRPARLMPVEMIRQILAEHPDRALHYTHIAQLVGARFENAVNERTLYAVLLAHTPGEFIRTSLGYYTLQAHADRVAAIQGGRRQLPDWYYLPWEAGVRLRLPRQTMLDRQLAYTWRITDADGGLRTLSARLVSGQTLPGEFHVTSHGEWEVAFHAGDERLWAEIASLPAEPLVFSAATGAFMESPLGEVNILIPSGWRMTGGIQVEDRSPVGEWRVVSARVTDTAPLHFERPDGSSWDARPDWIVFGKRDRFESGELEFEDGIAVYTNWPDIRLKADWVGTVQVTGPAGARSFSAEDIDAFDQLPRKDGLYTVSLESPCGDSRCFKFRLIRGLHLRRSVDKKTAWMLALPERYQLTEDEGIRVKPIGASYELELTRGSLSGRLHLRSTGAHDACHLLFTPPQVCWRMNHDSAGSWTRDTLLLSFEDLQSGSLWVDLRGVFVDAALTIEEGTGNMLGLMHLKPDVRKAYHLDELVRDGRHLGRAVLKLYQGGDAMVLARVCKGWHPRALEVEQLTSDPEGLAVLVQWRDEAAPVDRMLVFHSLSRPWEDPITFVVADQATRLEVTLPASGGYYEVVARSTERDELDFFRTDPLVITGSQDIVYLIGDEDAPPLVGWASQTADTIDRYFMRKSKDGDATAGVLDGLEVPVDLDAASHLLKGCMHLLAREPNDRPHLEALLGLLGRMSSSIKIDLIRARESLPATLVHAFAIPQLSTDVLELISERFVEPESLLLDGDESFWDTRLWLQVWQAHPGGGTRTALHDAPVSRLDEGRLGHVSRNLIQGWQDSPAARYQLVRWSQDRATLGYLEERLADLGLGDVYRFRDSRFEHLHANVLFRLHAVARLCRYTGRHDLPVDGRLSQITRSAAQVAGPLFWMALSYWEVNGD